MMLLNDCESKHPACYEIKADKMPALPVVCATVRWNKPSLLYEKTESVLYRATRIVVCWRVLPDSNIPQEAAGQHPCAPTSDTHIAANRETEQADQHRVGALSAHILCPLAELPGLVCTAFTLKLSSHNAGTDNQCCKPFATG